MTGRWSLARRMTVTFALTTVGLVLAISLISAVFIQRTISSELDSLLVEELDEVRAMIAGREVTDEAFARIVADLERSHPEVCMGWRLYDQDGGEYREFGHLDLLAQYAPDEVVLDQVTSPEPGLRWGARTLDLGTGQGGRAIGLVVDGSDRLAVLGRYGLAALVLVIVTAVLATLGGALFSRRVANMLAQIAESAQTAAESGELVHAPRDAPKEVARVVDAFASTLSATRAEGERIRLLVAGLAHELRSPIQNLMTETDVALMRERGRDEYRRVLESQVEELRDLGRVVDNLVTLCATRDRSPVRESFDLIEELSLRLDRERGQAQRAGVELEVETRGDLHLEGDREALVLVLRNLLGNAISFSPPGSTVHLRVNARDDGLELTVDDAGPGVAPEERERIFEPFYRGPTRAGRRVGYGLGLALSRSAAEAHQGRIDVDQSPAGGARFRLWLPR
jgi:two-component system, OmpR family, heavy metal sensor histidine kinase CusS